MVDGKSLRDLDRDLLNGELTEREAEIADAATRIAFDRAGDWLSTKQEKAERFPGGDVDRAAQEVYGWALNHG